MILRALLAALTLLAVAAPATASLAQVPPAQAQGFPTRDGPLSGMLMILPEEQEAEFDKPYDQPPTVTPLKTVRIGQSVVLKLVFIGPQPDADGMIDLTYDLRIIRPNGRVSEGGGLNGLPALRIMAEHPEAVFDNRGAIIKVTYEPGDPEGTWRYEATLRDNVSGRTLKLVAEVQLVP